MGLAPRQARYASNSRSTNLGKRRSSSAAGARDPVTISGTTGSESYTYGPESRDFTAYVRDEMRLNPPNVSEGWVSPRLGIRFDREEGALVVRGPDGRRFLKAEEIAAEAEQARHP